MPSSDPLEAARKIGEDLKYIPKTPEVFTRKILSIDYPIVIYPVEDEDGVYYIACLVDFGWTTCSAVGETKEEALENLDHVKKEVFQYFIESRKEFPEPSKLEF